MIHASAPGKILWVGGYSVLEKSNVSLVSAINARVHAYIKKRNDNKLILEMPQFGIKKEISELNENEKKTAKFVLSAINIVKLYLNSKGRMFCNCKIKTISDDAFSVNSGKSGLGSSAAVTVAVISALLAINNFRKDSELVHKLSQYAHALAQNKVGSGFDIAAATYGTIYYIRYSPSIINVANTSQIEKTIESKWDYSIEKVKWPKKFHIIIGNFKNQSTSTTGIVKKIIEFKKNNFEKYSKLIHKLNIENEKTISNIQNLKKFAYHFNRGRLLTKKLGEMSGTQIEPEKATKLIKLLIKNGALVAKLPGAGGGDSIGVICLNKIRMKKVHKLLKKQGNIEILNVRIENNGIIVKNIKNKNF